MESPKVKAKITELFKDAKRLIGTSKLAFCLVVGMFALFCHSRTDKDVSQAVSSHQPASIQEVKNKDAGSEKVLEQSIWVGRVADFQIRWTTLDIYIDDQKLLSPFVQKEFEEFVSDLEKDVRPGEQMLACDYGRYFSIVSIVGQLVSLDDQYGITCGKASIGKRFTVVNLANRQGPQTREALSWTGSRPGLRKRVRLSDYFDEPTIL